MNEGTVKWINSERGHTDARALPMLTGLSNISRTTLGTSLWTC
ncbi:hypothetical protein [Williamsia sp.]